MRNPFRYFNSSPEVIRLTVMMYIRYPLSLRQVEDILFERGIDICHETIRFWWNRFGPMFANEIRKRGLHHRSFSQWRWHLDEVFVRINGETHYLWRAVDQDGDTIDILVQRRRNKKAAARFFRRLLKGQGGEPRWLYTDKLKSDDAAHRAVMPSVEHINTVYANKRVEVSHQPTRQQKYPLRGVASPQQAQRFLTLHGLTQNLFRLGRHLIQAVNYRLWRTQSFQVWKASACA